MQSFVFDLYNYFCCYAVVFVDSPVITARQRSYGKVIFSLVSVRLFTVGRSPCDHNP